MPGPCHRCGRQVYLAEERLALAGSSWHQECFTCAVCNKSLDSTNLAENHENNEIYCTPCYRTLYAPKGYGYGPNEPTLYTNSGPEEECYDVTPTDQTDQINQKQIHNPAVIVKPFEQNPFRKGFLYWGRHPTPKHYGCQVAVAPRIYPRCDPHSTSGWQHPCQQRQCPSVQYSGPQRMPTPTISPCHPPRQHQKHPPSSAMSNHCNSGVELCARCGKPVYFAERKCGYHGVYHTRCYVCCSCGKSLETTTVHENNGILYCTGCYKRFIANGGVGFGVGAGALQTH